MLNRDDDCFYSNDKGLEPLCMKDTSKPLETLRASFLRFPLRVFQCDEAIRSHTTDLDLLLMLSNRMHHNNQSMHCMFNSLQDDIASCGNSFVVYCILCVEKFMK